MMMMMKTTKIPKLIWVFINLFGTDICYISAQDIKINCRQKIQ